MQDPPPIHRTATADAVARLRAAVAVPEACRGHRDRIIQARVAAFAPVLALLTAGWILLDARVLPLPALVPLAAVRLGTAAALLLLARRAAHLPAQAALPAFVGVQALGFALLQWLFPAAPAEAMALGYGLFPFAVAAQLALFPVSALQVLRLALAPAAMLAWSTVGDGRAFDLAARNDAWLLALLVFVAAWTAQSQLMLLVKLLGARREAAQDVLTGLANRRQADARLAAEHARCQRHGDPLSVLMADLDHFKRVNDLHGHATGDLVLAATAGAIAQELRASDLAARYGGEEFLVLMPETGGDAALHLAERVRARVAALRIPAGDASIAVTVSIGIAALRPGEAPAALVARADAALYRAKAEGRDRCIVDTAADP